MKTTRKIPPFALSALTSALLASFAPAILAQQVATAEEEEKARQEKAVKVETITVTTGARSAKAVDKIPGAIMVIGTEEIQHSLAITEDATAALARSIPGYAESSQALSNTGETLRGRTALRLFDGVPQTSPLREGNRSGSFTDMGLVGRIEVINGASASEGVGASGGIINYLSKVPSRPGTQVTLTSKLMGQFEDDSDGWKLGLDAAHKSDNFDLLVATSFIDRGISYDGNGRRIGLNTSGSLADSEGENLFLKLGGNFGAANAQRLQVSLSRFKLTGKGNYFLVDGNRDTGETNTSERGAPLGSLTSFNDFKQGQLMYTHGNFFGGILTANAYKASQAMRFDPESGSDRQDPLIAPLGTLIDQSEINSQKRGLRTSWAREDLFVPGLELRIGVDVVEDETQQSLALTNRLWVPPMLYESTAPWAQLSYDIGPVTLSGGFRREDGELSVNSYTTTYFRNRVFVEGGTLSYQENLPNFGIIWRLPMDFSVFASYGKGFGLPNVGIPLRNVNKPGQSVAGILDLQPVIVDNREAGFNWRGASGAFGASYYHSQSDFGVSLAIDPVTNDFIMRRQPIDIKGFEITGDYRLSRAWRVGGLYSRIRGKTVNVDGGPLVREMGVLDINPDKLGAWVEWRYSERGHLRLGSTTLMSRDLNEGQSGEEHTKGYTLVDLDAKYDMGKYGTLTLGVENLFDKFYVLSWSQVVGFRNFWSGRGRMLSLTHTLTF